MLEEFQLLELNHFFIEQIRVQSKCLEKSPLKERTNRVSPVLVPENFEGDDLGLVFVLPGFTGNGPKYFGPRSFEENMPEQIDRMVGDRLAPKAIYVFVDAWSFWGGAQLLNSAGAGAFEDYFIKELYKEVLKYYPVNPKKIALMGASSGAYAALHLASKYPNLFSYVAAFAPDSFFEAAYLPDLYKASNFLENKSWKELKELHKRGRILNRRDGHSILNAIGMTCVYSPNAGKGVHWPIDLKTGNLQAQVWKRWKEYDPVVFLKKRAKNTHKLRAVFLEVGDKDQFHLQFGARQIRDILKKSKLRLHYNEFDGNHFDFPVSRENMLQWLKKEWKQ